MKNSLLIMAISTLFLSQIEAKSATTLIKENGCLSCHGITTRKDAPPFAAIAMRASRWSTNPKAWLKSRIRNGSSGRYMNFAGAKMPAFKNLSDRDLDKIASWILSKRASWQRNRGYHGNGWHGGQHMGRQHMMGRW